MQRHALLRAAHDDDELRAPAELADRLAFDQGGEPVERDRRIALREQAFDMGAPHFDGGHAAHHLDQCRRHGHACLATAQHDDLRHRRCQWQHEAQAHALAGAADGLDAAAHGIDLGAHHVHADATPGELGHRAGGGETGQKDQLRQLVVAGRLIAIQQTALDSAFANARQVQPAAVVAELDADFVARLRDLDGDGAHRALARTEPHLGALDAVHDAVAQQVLKRADHALKHAAVDFDGAAHEVQAHLLAGVLGRLAHHAVKAIGKALEVDHARAQQVILQLAREARLRGELIFCRLQRALQSALHGGDVVDRLGHHAREFLQPREAVHLERIEGLRRGLGSLDA